MANTQWSDEAMKWRENVETLLYYTRNVKFRFGTLEYNVHVCRKYHDIVQNYSICAKLTKSFI